MARRLAPAAWRSPRASRQNRPMSARHLLLSRNGDTHCKIGQSRTSSSVPFPERALAVQPRRICSVREGPTVYQMREWGTVRKRRDVLMDHAVVSLFERTFQCLERSAQFGDLLRLHAQLGCGLIAGTSRRLCRPSNASASSLWTESNNSSRRGSGCQPITPPLERASGQNVPSDLRARLGSSPAQVTGGG